MEKCLKWSLNHSNVWSILCKWSRVYNQRREVVGVMKILVRKEIGIDAAKDLHGEALKTCTNADDGME